MLLQIGKWNIILRNPGPSTTVTRLHVTSKAPSDESYPITTRAFLSHQRIDFDGMNTSQVAAPMLPVGDPAMLITVNFFYGNVFYIVRKAKLAWLHLVQP